MWLQKKEVPTQIQIQESPLKWNNNPSNIIKRSKKSPKNSNSGNWQSNQRVRSMRRHMRTEVQRVDGGRRSGRWRWVVGTPVNAVKRRVRGRDHRRNVDLVFRKSYLRILTKPATNRGGQRRTLTVQWRSQNTEVAILSRISRTRR